MKILKWIFGNFLLILTLFLLVFIPLYPKIPLIDIKNTWVYIRVEDLLIVFSIVSWVVVLLLKKASLKTPLTLPILIFWLIGILATLHGVLLIFPTIANVYSNVAFLSMMRRIEYLSLFFIAFAAMREKRAVLYVIWTQVIVLLSVALYGFGQKFLNFPAYLTMNEEFAKGIPVHLSQLSRVPSTFAGHYDLAAYLVLIIPILISLIFGFKNLLIKFSLLGVSALGFILLFMTVSRVSFFVLLVSLVMLLIFQQKKWLIASLLVVVLVLFSFAPSLIARFGDTLKEVDVLVDASTGNAIGQVKSTPANYFEDKVVKRQIVNSSDEDIASASAILPFAMIPDPAQLLVESNLSTGENLPQGTSYINLPMSTVVKRIPLYFYDKSRDSDSSPEVQAIYGDYLIKKAIAYDLSFTTRFQGEWPATFLAFKRNIFLGSGYGSVSLAVDNNYLRILGESGLFGLASFLSIFLIALIYIRKILPSVDSPVVKCFALGFVAGAFGLALNATLIDVFEASKVAFTLWLLMGITLGILHLYKKGEINFIQELRSSIASTWAIVIGLIVATIVLFSTSSYFFVGDDFTWFRWVTDPANNIFKYFTDSNGFFYRPGTKLYFYLMHSGFWLNQAIYHFVSVILHAGVAILIFLISKRILKSYMLAVGTAFLFLLLTGYHEAVFWISATGFLFTAFFALLSLLFYIYWREKKKVILFVVSIVSIILGSLFHELGIVIPLILIVYDIVYGERRSSKFLNKEYLVLLLPLLPYFVFRLISQSHWFNGDYSYDLFNLPFNFAGNAFGYLALGFLGPRAIPLYEILRESARNHILLSGLVSLIVVFVLFLSYRFIFKRISNDDKKIVVFSSLFFIISLLPFLGLGNITSRYSYLSSFAIVIFLILIFRMTYNYLLIYGKNIAILTLALIITVFSGFQLFQLQSIHTDWKVAGEKSKRLLVGLDQLYQEKWKEEKVKLYFVNVPIRNGEAWVFPVGFSDAAWFAYKNENISIYIKGSLSEALDQAGESVNSQVFQFDDNGIIYRAVKTKDSFYLKKVQ
ncbi:MAG: O-antigen ligase family protein [Candidatus Levybacteria bacterium]|nr:O-antigen ligase family protein [Candidatus Levybacteria bacterium]